jgi:hypothetical protein
MAESHVHKQEKDHTQAAGEVKVCGDRGGTEATPQPPTSPDPNYTGGTTRDPGESGS